MRKRAAGTHDQDSYQQPTQRAATMNTAERRIGRAGTISRVIVALGLLCLALTHGGLSWRLTWYDAALGLIVFPAVMVVAGLAARRFTGRDVHFTAPLGVAVNCAVIIALL